MIIEVTITNGPIKLLKKKLMAQNWTHMFRKIAQLISRHPAHLFDWQKDGSITFNGEKIGTFVLLVNRTMMNAKVPGYKNTGNGNTPDIVYVDEATHVDFKSNVNNDPYEEQLKMYDEIIPKKKVVKSFWQKVLSFL